MSNYHVVRQGDTLARIARHYGTTVAELRNLNDLRDPNRLAIGQKIALRKEYVCGFEALFLDADRNPIKGMEYVLDFCGKSIKGTTGADGKAKKITTESPTDRVRILVRRFDGTLKEVARLMSGYRNTLATLVSPLLVIETELKPHPPQAQHAGTGERIKPVYGSHNPPRPTVGKKELGPTPRQTATPDGKPVTVVEGDIPGFDFLVGYMGQQLTEADYQAAANEIGCETEVIKAIEKIESGGRTGFDERNRPIILYERHVFSRNTQPPGKYDRAYPDISSCKGYSLKRKDDVINEQEQRQNYYAVSSDANYKRLAKAYQLDRDAALKACSWGKFQVLGENFKELGFTSVRHMVDAHVKGQAGHLQAFVGFVKSKGMQIAMKEKNWEKIARAYNGKSFKKFKYDERIQKAYEDLKRK